MTDTMQLQRLSDLNQQTLNNIRALELEEQTLFRELSSMNKTQEEKDILINRINQLSQIRTNLYDNSRDLFAFYTANVNDARSTLGQEVSAIKILETELNEAKERFNSIENQKNDKLRLVQINTYFGKRYNAQKEIMQIIFFTCIAIFIVLLIKNKLGVIPDNVSLFLTGLILAIGIGILIYRIIDFSNRDNMNFDEYNWKFDKKTAPLDINKDPSVKVPWTYGLTCMGSQCCDSNSEYNSELNICVPKVVSQTQTQPSQVETPIAMINPLQNMKQGQQNAENFTGMCQYSMGRPNIITRLLGNQVKPMESMSDKMNNYASF
jgi:prefoldin subunit 5